MQRKINLTRWFVYKWEKPIQQKSHWVILRSPLPKFHYYHNKRLQVKESPYLIPIYNWTLTPIPNWTCSVVTISPFDARLPSTWLTNCVNPNTQLQSATREDCWLQSSSVHPNDADQEDAWSQNPTVHIHSNFFKRKRWIRVRTSSPVIICLKWDDLPLFFLLPHTSASSFYALFV